MNEIVAVFIAIFVLIGGIVAYGVISTSMGYEEDENQNYIPDRLERMFGKDPSAKKGKEQDKKQYSLRAAHAVRYYYFLCLRKGQGHDHLRGNLRHTPELLTREGGQSPKGSQGAYGQEYRCFI